MNSEQIVIDSLYTKYNSDGFVTEDDIFDLCTEYNLPLHRIDYVCDKVISMGVLISDRKVTDNEDEDANDETRDFALIDYEQLYKRCIDICPEMAQIINYIRKTPPPQKGEAKRLIIQARSGNLYARKNLVEIYMRTALRIAVLYNDKTDIALEDLFSAACFGLIKSVDNYDISEHGYFNSYVSFRISRYVERYIADNDSIIRIPVYQYDNIEKITFYSFEEVLELGDLYSDDYEKMIDCVELNELKTDVRNALNNLSKKEADIIRLRFGFSDTELTLEEVGQYFNVTRERIRQIEAKAVRKLRHPVKGKKLKQHWEAIDFMWGKDDE